jgi:DNA (cytosine-5)-methyltransferase 1
LRYLLDLYCGAGGATAGYQRAGFHVTGVDVEPQPRYVGDTFRQEDALVYLRSCGDAYDVIHASPPCQRYSRARYLCPNSPVLPYVIPQLLEELEATGRPYVVENVPQAKILSRHGVLLCGLMFGLKVLRHRMFWSNQLLFSPDHPSHCGVQIGNAGFRTLAGNGYSFGRESRRRMKTAGAIDNTASWREAIGIPWMTRAELAQAIPPAYAEYLGRQLAYIVGA